MSEKSQIKKTRNLEKSRKEILSVAFTEVHTRGFQGVSVDNIVEKTSLTKGAFYHHFPTKLDLGYALVEEVITPMVHELWIKPLEKYENPIEGIFETLKNFFSKISAAQLKFGCPLNNLVQEMTPVDRGFHRRLQGALNHWVNELEPYLKMAQEKGFLKPDLNTKETALFIVMLHEGTFGIAKGLGDPATFKPMLDSLEKYFKSIAP